MVDADRAGQSGWRRVFVPVAASGAVVYAVAMLIVTPAHAASAATREATAQPAVTVAVQPAQVQIAAGATQPVVAVVANDGGTAISNVRLRWQQGTGGGVEVAPATRTAALLAGGASASFEFSASRSYSASKQADAVLVTTYHDNAAKVDRAIATTMTVGAADEQASPSAALAVDASTAVAELQQYRTTDVKLTVTNGSAVPRTITSVDLAAPSFVEVSYRGSETLEPRGGLLRFEPRDLRLAGGQQAALLFHVEMDRQLEPGDAFMVFTVSSEDDRGTTAATVASVKMTFSVLGESAFLSVIGVPSVYLLPGLVFAVVLWLLRGRVFPRVVADGGSEGGLGLDTKAAFWVLALPPCLVLPFLYPTVTEWVLGSERDYRRAYGFDDILYVWTLAAALAFAVWFVWWVAPALAGLAWRRTFVPQPGDPPPRLLWKLARRGPWASLQRPRATCESGGQSRPGRVLAEVDAAHVLFSPPLLIRPSNERVTAAVSADHPIRTAFWMWWYRRDGGRLWYGGGGGIDVLDATSVTVQDDRAALVEVAADGQE